jgi:histidine triad (HIT) family protein
MNDCIFCKISKEEIPSAKVYEDSEFFAFLDINPVVKGHTILIPKAHSRWMQNTDDETVGKIFIVAKKIMNKIQGSLSCDYVSLNVVGEEVEHFHIHLMPRYLGDKIATFISTPYESPEEKDEYANKIRG